MRQAATPLPGISAAEIEKLRRPLASAFTLPPAAYTSEAVYDREVETIMRQCWLPLARLDQVPEPGSYLSLDLFGQPVMVVHGTDGEIRVLSRVCLHRAAPLVEGSGRRKLFTCPYHAWSYDTAGSLVRAPLMEGADGFEPERCRLPELRSEIWEGFILASLDPEAAPFAPQVETFRRHFEAYRLADMVVVRTLDYDSPWNWKVLAENFMEAYHHIATHAATLEPAFHARDSRVPDNDGPWSILHMPAAPHGEAAEEGAPPGLPPVEGLDPARARDLYAAVIFPHFLLALQGNAVFWYQLLPEAAGSHKLRIHILVPRSSTALPGFDDIAAGTAELVAYIHQEDIGANDLVWQGLAAPLTAQGRLSPLEKAIWQMNRWWCERMAPEA